MQAPSPIIGKLFEVSTYPLTIKSLQSMTFFTKYLNIYIEMKENCNNNGNHGNNNTNNNKVRCV